MKASLGTTILRISMALVIIWFGVEQVTNTAPWIGFLPDWVSSMPISAESFVTLNGWFEIVFGSLLLVGLYTRLSALLLGVHLLGITVSIGYDALGVRDFGLAMATLSLVLSGAGAWSLDELFEGGQNGKKLV